MKFLGGVSTPEAIREALVRITGKYESWGRFGVWIAETKSGEFVGWFSLKPLPGTEEIEIGYRLARGQWGKGYASEGARRMRDFGINELGLKRIVAITDRRNVGSKKVLLKTGLKFQGDKPAPNPDSRACGELVSWFVLEV